MCAGVPCPLDAKSYSELVFGGLKAQMGPNLGHRRLQRRAISRPKSGRIGCRRAYCGHQPRSSHYVTATLASLARVDGLEGLPNATPHLILAF